MGRQLTGEPADPPARVWYAAFGSNCDGPRLAAYLAGGRLAATGVVHRGSADPSPPRDDRRWTFTGPLRFTGRSAAWGGATAVLAHGPGRSLGRVWQLAWRQLEDVFAQENDIAHRRLTLADARRGAVLGEGRYGRLCHLGELDGLAVVTFTAPDAGRQPAGAPSAVYLRTIVAGLLAAHPLAVDELAGWLLAADGVAHGWDRPALVALINAVARG